MCIMLRWAPWLVVGQDRVQIFDAPPTNHGLSAAKSIIVDLNKPYHQTKFQAILVPDLGSLQLLKLAVMAASLRKLPASTLREWLHVYPLVLQRIKVCSASLLDVYIFTEFSSRNST